MAEWPNAFDLKSKVPDEGTVGSNPTASVMTNQRILDALYDTIDNAFATKRFDEVNGWIGKLDIDWLFKKSSSVLCGWLVTTSWATRRGIKMPNRDKLSARCKELMTEHKDWFDRMDEVDNGGPFAHFNLTAADAAWNEK